MFHTPFLSNPGLQPAALTLLLTLLQPLKFAQGFEFVRVGDKTKEMFIVTKGEVALKVADGTTVQRYGWVGQSYLFCTGLL